MINDILKATGKLDITLYDKNNKVKKFVSVPNLIVTTGYNYIASRIAGNSTLMSHMAVGTDATAPNISQLTLVTEIARVGITSATAVGATATFTATFGTGVGTGTLTEAGVFNDVTAGNMLCRTTFSPLVKEADDILTINWNITVS